MAESASTTPPPTVVNGSGDGTPPVSDQQHFDEVVDRDSRIVLAILGGVAVLAALIMSTVALVQSSNKAVTTITKTVTTAAATTGASQAAAATPAQVISFKVNGGWKKGPDGKLHDAFTQTEFHVKVGQTVELKVDNEDESAHSITSPEAGVNLLLMPGVHTYTMVVKQAGRFFWDCIVPCDTEANGWAMKHPGYMAGYITAS